MKVQKDLFSFKSNELLLPQTLKITGGRSILTQIIPERDEEGEEEDHDDGN